MSAADNDDWLAGRLAAARARPTPPPCDHAFSGWREHPDGLGGEQFCQKCGLGAMDHTLSLGDLF